MAERHEIIARFKTMREQRLKLSQAALAASLGVTPGAIGQIETGASGVSARILKALGDRFSVNAAWLTEGREPMIFERPSVFEGRKVVVEAPDKTKPGHGELRIQGKDYALVRRMGLSVSAGSGLEEPEPEDEDGLLLPTAWFGQRGINPDLCVIVSVRGDSMTPGIPDWLAGLIDCATKVVHQAGVYAFALDGNAYVKRLIPSIDGPQKTPVAITMVSDSPTYAPVPLIGHRMNALRIVGRVRAVLADL
ncbi:MAG: LexA family transcriptional regulator [Rhodobacteraceae bacterium]|nr:LexA family transcriptional regulator [Paracoccaceae bacterium]